MGSASFLSTAFTIDALVNSLDGKLVNPISVYSVDSIKRTVHLAFHGILLLPFFQKISIKNTVNGSNSIFNRKVRLIESTE